MNVPLRLALFAGLLVAVFGAATLVGAAAGPDEPVVAEEPAHDEEPAAGHAGESSGAAALPGLASVQDGLRLELVPAADDEVAFRVVADTTGEPVRDFELAHGKRMHLIVVRRDLATFEHLHPEMDDDGVWRAPADLSRAGAYRVFADFTRGGAQRTLGADRHVAGDYAPRRLPAVTTRAKSDGGLDVTLRRVGDRIEFDVPGAKLEPYLEARGHLVTLRASDLAYLHTHPDSDALAFEVAPPSAGAYRHFVQFQVDGRVHTAAFTEEVSP